MHLTAASLSLGLSAMAHAIPSLQPRLPPGTAPPRSAEFSLAMNVSGYVVPLSAIYFPSRGVLLRAAGTHDPDLHTPGKFSSLPPPPSLFSSFSNTSFADHDHFPDAVNLDLLSDPYVSAPPGVYGLFAADPGASHGVVSEVTGTKDVQHFDFSVVDGRVGHKMTSAAQAWFACATTIESVKGTYLSWGTYEANFSAPYGCRSTDVIQVFNLTRRESLIWD